MGFNTPKTVGKTVAYLGGDLRFSYYLSHYVLAIASIDGGQITTAAFNTPGGASAGPEHCLVSGDRVIVVTNHGIFKTTATVIDNTTFSIPESIKDCAKGHVLIPTQIQGTLAANIYTYAFKKNVLPGILTATANSPIVKITNSVEFPFSLTDALLHTADGAIDGKSIIDVVTEQVQSRRCKGIFTHKIIMGNIATETISTEEWYVEARDRTGPKQGSLLAGDAATFLGDPDYGEIFGSIPANTINLLGPGEFLLGVKAGNVFILIGDIEIERGL